MSDLQQAGKERRARPPKPLKPKQPTPVKESPAEESQNHVKPVAPPKPKGQPFKKEYRAKVEEENQSSCDSDQDVSSLKKEVSSPFGSPSLPPRRNRTPKPNQPTEQNNLENVEVEINGTREINPPRVPEKPVNVNSAERPLTRPKPPLKKISREEIIEAETSGESDTTLANGSVSKVSSHDRLKGEDSSNSPSSDPASNSSDTKSSEGTLVDVKKVALKPKPSRPPPPSKRPSVLLAETRGDSVGHAEEKEPLQPPEAKPKPQKLPSVDGTASSSSANLTSQKESKVRVAVSKTFKQSLESSAVESIAQPNRPPRKKHTLATSESIDGKGMENNHVERVETESKVTGENQKDTKTSIDIKKPKPKRPVPPPTKSKPSIPAAPEAQSVSASKTPTSPQVTSPQISKSEKRLSNGTMFAVIGGSKAVQEGITEETVTKSVSQGESRESPALRDGVLKPQRPAPMKPPPPDPGLLKQRSSIRESPSSSPVHKASQKEKGSPQRQGSQRPAAAPPAPPPKAGGKKDAVEKGSVKAPPKRPPPVSRKPLKDSTPIREDSRDESMGVDESGGVSGKDEVSNTSSKGQSELGEEDEPRHVPSLVVDEEKGDAEANEVTTPTGGAPEGTDDVFSGDDGSSSETTAKTESFLSVQDSFDDFDDFSDFSDDEEGSKAEVEAEASDAAFIETLAKLPKKAYQVAKEIRDSEGVFVDVLRLLNEDFKSHIEFAKGPDNQPVIEKAVLAQVIGYLPQLQLFNEELLSDLKDRIEIWKDNPKVSDIFVKKGPFLKLFTTYIQNFEKQKAALMDACSKYPLFNDAVKEFEATERCRSLHIIHYMLKPVQRIPQYKMLLTDYQKNLEPGSVDEEDTKLALEIVSEVASHVNNDMKAGDNFTKLLSIQHSIIGQHDIVKPGRTFIKEGILHKISRKQFQQRKLFLFNDVLLTTSIYPTGLKMKTELPLAGMRVGEPTQIKDHENEFNIISVERSFTLAASSPEEKEEWTTAIKEAVATVINKNKTFQADNEVDVDTNQEFELGSQAPVWIPDTRVTMCMICTSEFTMTFRRHHCRACGKVVCSECSPFKAKLEYLGKKDRVCQECFQILGGDSTPVKVSRKKSHIKTPKLDKFTEVRATDEDDVTIKGYLHYKEKRSFKRMWYVIKNKVLYTYKASEDVKALKTFPLLGFEVKSEGGEIRLTQKTVTYIFKADNDASTAEWVAAFQEAAAF